MDNYRLSMILSHYGLPDKLILQGPCVLVLILPYPDFANEVSPDLDYVST